MPASGVYPGDVRVPDLVGGVLPGHHPNYPSYTVSLSSIRANP